MWKVTATVNGERLPLESLAIENDRAPSLEQVRQAANNLRVPNRFVEYLDRELNQADSRSIRSFDAVQRWSVRAEAEANEFETTRGRLVSLRDAEGALAYFVSPRSRRRDQPDTVVWHDHSTVLILIPTDVQQLRIEYQAEPQDAERFQRLNSQFRSPPHRVETILDARGYHGTESAVIDLWRTMRVHGDGYVTSIRRTAGVLVGRILRRVTIKHKQLDDWTFRGRLVDRTR